MIVLSCPSSILKGIQNVFNIFLTLHTLNKSYEMNARIVILFTFAAKLITNLPRQ
jgi:hypothetical protein